MCSSSRAPRAQPVLPEAPTMPDDPSRTGTEDERRRRRAAANSTILTGPQGVQGAASTESKMLLGG